MSAGRGRDALARLRAFDRSPGGVEAVRRVRRALPGDAAYGDPLSVSGRDSASTVVRVAGQLFDEQPRASREAGLGALQVWTALTGARRRARGDQQLTVLFTDLVGFSEWSLRAGDDDTLRLLRAVAAAIEPPVAAHRGRVVKRMGDGLMAAFHDPQAAFDAVTSAREALAEIEVAGHRPQLRAGLHTGRPKVIGDDLVGVDVNVAARICQRAGTDEVLVSDTTCAGLDPEQVSCRRKKSFAFTRAKGVPEGLVVYAATPRPTPDRPL